MAATVSTKLIGLAFAGVAASIGLLGWMSVTRGSEALLEQQSRALEAVRHSRQGYIEGYFDIIREQAFNFAQDEMIVRATEALSEAFARLPAQLDRDTEPGGELYDSLVAYYDGEFRPRLETAGLAWKGAEHFMPASAPARILQALYISDNDNPVGHKHDLVSAGTGTDYDRLHGRYHPRIRTFLESFGFYDIFLFDLDGNLVYSVFKETDFATNFLAGPYSDTNLAEVYREARDELTAGQIVIRDFAPYEPSYGAPASFIGSPVHDGARKIGVAVFQMPMDKINEIMTSVAGLGDSGETYLIGRDMKMRSNSRFDDTSSILVHTVDTEASRRALRGEAGMLRQLDYRDVAVLSSYGPLGIAGLEWAMLAEIDMAEVTAPAAALRNRIIVVGVVLTALVCLVTLFLLRRLVLDPVAQLVHGARDVQRGDYSSRVHVESRDELGELAGAFNEMTRSVEREIADRERAERDARRAREAADDANQAKSTFLANMSHELRTPMNAILGYSEMLMEDAEDDGNEATATDLRKIHAAGQHLLSLINGVLDLSKVEAGKMDLYLETFEVQPMIDDVVNTIRTVIEKNDNRLVLECADGLGSIRADLTKLRQTLFNLLSNAAKFTRDGTITLAAARDRDNGRDWLRLSVSDSGIGIAEDKLGHIFEEFAQADASTTREFGGTGLGLAITKRFCEMMDGTIDVDSTLGVGTTFTVRLPARVGVTAGSPATASAMDVEPGSCVLVIDDDSSARDLMKRSLERDGFDVACAADGDSGIELARSLRPAAITLDVMMPGKDGWAVLSELKADPDLRDIPVIMVSMVEDRSMGYALGATEYMTKPVDRDQLTAILNRYRCHTPPCTVLLVEDDAEIRDVTQRALEKEGWNVMIAENGQVGLERVQERIPELIFLDLMMPVMDGFHFLHELRKVDAWKGIPVVVVTAKDLTADDRARLSGSVTAVIEKGAFERDELLDRVRELVLTCSR